MVALLCALALFCVLLGALVGWLLGVTYSSKAEGPPSGYGVREGRGGSQGWRRIHCRALTSDARHLRPGNAVYVDFAGFVWPMKSNIAQLEIDTMGMRPGIFIGRRKLLGFIPWGTIVDLLRIE